MQKLLAYLKIDCEATLSMLDCLIEFAEENDLDLRYTIGGSSWATAKRWLGIGDAEWGWGARKQSASALYMFARLAYFGGRTQVFRPMAESGWRYDINSAYPAALAALELPSGVPREVWNSEARRSWNAGREGLYRARVRIPECHIPPLPVRGDVRLRYPFGIVEGVWAANELRYAEEVGARIEKIDVGLVWSSREVVFAPLCRPLWDLRDRKGPKTAYGVWCKWFANSLTGRLAIRPEGETIVIGGDPASIKPCPADWDCRDGALHGSSTRRCCVHSCTRRCGAVLPVGEWGQNFGIFVRHRWQIADSAHIHYAAYLTAHARIALHRQLIDDDAGGYSAVYCDTDSVYSIVERTNNIGPRLGEFKPEGSFSSFHALAPKTYSYCDSESGEREVRSKGIEPSASNFDLLVSGGTVKMDRGVKSIRSAMRENEEFFVRKSISRRVLSTEDEDGVKWYGDRYLGPDGATYPVREDKK